MAKIGTPLSARGSMKDARIPTSEKENGPSSLRHSQGIFPLNSGGTEPAAHTIDSSSGVRVTDVRGPLHTHSGKGASPGNRHTSNRPGTHANFRVHLIMIEVCSSTIWLQLHQTNSGSRAFFPPAEMKLRTNCEPTHAGAHR